ncbi:MAG: hypothetical protein AB1758_13845 [Candidatus Eremiobacterota bacterium]
MHFPDLPYDCLQCGKGCQGGWRVLADEPSMQRLTGSPPVREARSRGYEPFQRCDDGLYRLGSYENGHCLFLRPDRLCAIHADLGFEAKPRACRQFPFLLVETPDGPVVGLSFRCTAVQQGHGRPCREHRPQLEELRATGHYPRVGERAHPLLPGYPLDWRGYLQVEDFVLGCVRRLDLWRACAAVAAVGSRHGTLDELPGVQPPPPSDLLTALGRLVLAGLIACLEASDYETMQRHTRTLQQGGSLTSRRGITLHLDAPPDPAHALQVRRYLEHLVFRKFLLLGESILARLAALLLAEQVLRCYAAGFGALGPALDVVEGEVMTHSPDMEGYFAAIEDGLLRHLTSA